MCRQVRDYASRPHMSPYQRFGNCCLVTDDDDEDSKELSAIFFQPYLRFQDDERTSSSMKVAVNCRRMVARVYDFLFRQVTTRLYRLVRLGPLLVRIGQLVCGHSRAADVFCCSAHGPMPFLGSRMSQPGACGPI